MYETILFPTDGTDHADSVGAHAIDIAATRDATLHVLSVVDDRAFLILSEDRVADVRADLRERALEAIDEAATTAIDHGVAVETATDDGRPAECILEYAETVDADLIVMGSSGDRYERNVVGSVSQQVVRRSPVPVLTVGPDA